MTPRSYQLEIISGVKDGWKMNFRKQLVVSPTGSGKTCVFSWLAKDELPGRSLILAHREELIDQAIAKLFSATGIRAEKEKAEFTASLSASVVVASFQTVARRLDKWPRDHFSLVIADEAHHAISPSQQAVLKHFDEHAKVIGVTATPDRGDKKNLGQYFENIAKEIKLFDLIDDGYLSKITLRSIPIEIDLNGVRQTAGDFNEADLGHALEPYLDEIARSIKQHAGNRRTLAFLPLIATSRKFVEACRTAGLSAEHVDGESADRKEILQRFADWEFDVLSNAMLLTEGYDDPSIDCIVCLRPTRSRSLYAQICGRGTRIDSLKENLLLLDFLWLHSKLKICRPAHLIAQSEEEAEAITAIAQKQSAMPADLIEQLPLDLQQLSGIATSEREENLRKRLEENRKKQGKYVSAEEFALQHHRLDVAEFEPVSAWHSLPVTEPQSRALKRAKIDPETVHGRGHASALLNVHFQNQTLVLASPQQRQKMRQMGYENADVATAAEARKFFSTLRAA